MAYELISFKTGTLVAGADLSALEAAIQVAPPAAPSATTLPRTAG